MESSDKCPLCQSKIFLTIPNHEVESCIHQFVDKYFSNDAKTARANLLKEREEDKIKSLADDTGYHEVAPELTITNYSDGMNSYMDDFLQRVANARNIINARREAMIDNNVNVNHEENHLQDDESSEDIDVIPDLVDIVDNTDGVSNDEVGNNDDVGTDNDSNLETMANVDGDSGDQGDNAIEETDQSRLAGWRTNDHVNDEVDNIDDVDTNNVNDSNSETNDEEIDSNENVDKIGSDLEKMSIDEAHQWLRSRLTHYVQNDTNARYRQWNEAYTKYFL